MILLVVGGAYFQEAPSSQNIKLVETPAEVKKSTYEELKIFPQYSLPLLKSAGHPYLNDEDAVKPVVGNKEFNRRTVLVNFWASWCEVCKTEKPFLRELQLEFFEKNFTVLGVATSDEKKAILDSGILDMITYPVVFDQPGVLMEKLNIRALPVSYLIDRQGNILRRFVGPINEKFRDEIQGVLRSR